MRFYEQLILHDPDQGQWGDCFRACIASFVDQPIEEVPHVFDEGRRADEAYPILDTYLGSLGYRHALIAFQAHHRREVLDMMETTNPNVYWIFHGMSPRNQNHVVICKGGFCIHDPHPDGGGVTEKCDDGYFWASFITRDYRHEDD